MRAARTRMLAVGCIPNLEPTERLTMHGGFSKYLEEVAGQLPQEADPLIRGDLNLTLIDWYTSGIPAIEAIQRIKRSVGWG
jgi:hypothetical protein